MIQYIETTAGKLYADCEDGDEYVKYVEIGFCDSEENHIPIAALEVRSKKINEEIDETAIIKVLYNPEDDTDIKYDIVKRRDKHERTI